MSNLRRYRHVYKQSTMWRCYNYAIDVILYNSSFFCLLFRLYGTHSTRIPFFIIVVIWPFASKNYTHKFSTTGYKSVSIVFVFFFFRTRPADLSATTKTQRPERGAPKSYGPRGRWPTGPLRLHVGLSTLKSCMAMFE